MLAICVCHFFLPVQSLLTCFRSSLTCFADFVSLFSHYNSSSDSKAFLRFIAFSGSPKAVHCPLHALQHYTVGILLVKDSHNCLSSTEKPQYHVLNHTLPLRTCYEEVYGNIAHEENG